MDFWKRAPTLRRFSEETGNLWPQPRSGGHALITRGRSTPREQIRDEIIPFHLDFYGVCGGGGKGITGDFLGCFYFRWAQESADLGYWLRGGAWNFGMHEGSQALIYKSFTISAYSGCSRTRWRPMPPPGG